VLDFSVSGFTKWTKDAGFSAVSLLPAVQRKLAAELSKLESQLEHSVKGKEWQSKSATLCMPQQGLSAEAILTEMRAAAAAEVSAAYHTVLHLSCMLTLQQSVIDKGNARGSLLQC
jgi:predicted ATPase with chaperone activity